MPRQSKEKKVINGVGTGRRTAPARGGDAYSAPAVYVKEAGLWKIYYICRDYLGSITHIANADGTRFSVVCHLAATMFGVASSLRQAKNKAVICVMREHYF